MDMLHKQFPDATVNTGRAAQESVVKSTAGQYRYVHLASHAFFNDASPLLSSIVLAQPPAGSQDDGFLTAREIFDLNLQADMVVLSACNTARGGKQSGEGIIGLTWALFVAGVPTQVVSQWAVDDASTATLMGAFYADLNSGKSAALQSAELKLLRDGKHAHPYYWAPFTLMGDWR
jgi:CHAT domain-containing protein